MNENLANEIRKTIESIKDMKAEASGINNHLGVLEGLVRFDNQKKVDEAYGRGYDKGYADKTNNDEVCNELAKDIYQRGLNDAWEAARKIVLSPDEGGTSLTDIYVMFGNNGSMQRVFRSYSASEVIEKLKAYEEKQKADEEIKVGDEVIDTQTGARFCVTHFWKSNHGDKGVSGFNRECSAFQVTIGKAKKTGRHFDIDKILEEMRT